MTLRSLLLSLRLPLPALVLALCATSAQAALKPGDPAPMFKVEAARGGKVFIFDLAEALKKGPVVLYFYPKSFTSVCTLEAHQFAESVGEFAAADASVIGLSGDDLDVQREFSAKECRDKLPVGADPSFNIIKAYDAAMTIPGTTIGFANRISYVIGPNGKIVAVTSDPGAELHIQRALAAVRELKGKNQN